MVRLPLWGCALVGLVLATRVPPDVVANADAGVKFLLTRQFAAGDLRATLQLPAEPWVEELWRAGIYPLRYPTVIERDGQRFGLFPLAFPLLTAPFYRWLGFPGLLALPVLGFWATLWALVRAGRGLRLSARAIAFATIALGLASPLLIYSAMFWEHSLALGLCTAGVALTVAAPALPSPPRRYALLGGLLLGAATLLREELVVPAVLLVPATWAAFPLERRTPVRAAGAALGLALAGLSIAGWNAWHYGHPLGIHALAAVQSTGWAQASVARVFVALARGLADHAPVVLLAPPLALVIAFTGRAARARRALLLLWLALLVVVLMPVVVRSDGGKQWGPRYLFGILPPLLLAVVGLAQAVRARPTFVRRFAGALLVLGLARGAWVNAVIGVRWLDGTYARRSEAVASARELPAEFVAVSHSSVALDLVALVGRRTLFQTTQGSQLRTLARALQRRGVSRMGFICHASASDCGPLRDLPERLQLLRAGSGELLVDLHRWRSLDRYTFYLGEIAPAP